MITLPSDGVRRGTNPSQSGGPLTVLRREFAFWRARRRLGALDEDGLHDLGIGRGEIEDAVRHGRGSLT